MSLAHTRSYGERAQNATNPTAKLLLETIERKKSNLAVSVDVTNSGDLLAIIEAVAPYVCLIKARLFTSDPVTQKSHPFTFKTHVDIIEDFDFSLIERLQHLSQKYDFLYFEDRKFADIGEFDTMSYVLS